VVRGTFAYYDVESLIDANPDALVYGGYLSRHRPACALTRTCIRRW